MSNQDIEGNAPAEGAPGAPTGALANLEQELAKERDARAQMRDRLRHTEALAAESHALRSRMAEELARVTADRDRLRSAAASAAPTEPSLEATVPLRGADPPAFTPRATEWPPKSPVAAPPPARRGGPWRALAMLGGLAVVVGAAAWFTGHMPGRSSTLARDTSPPAATSAAAPGPAPAERVAPPTAATVLAGGAPEAANTPSGAVALPPVTPEAQLAAAPTAAGPAPTPAPMATGPAPTAVPMAAGPAPTAVPMATGPAPTAAPAGIAARLRKALDDEGIGAPVDIDAASGHVTVADPQADRALRDRTDMLIRAVYAGASLPEPQIEHRWLSPKRAGQPTPGAEAAATPAQAARVTPAPSPAPATKPAPVLALPASPAPPVAMTPAQAYAARHAPQDRSLDRGLRKPLSATVAEAEELRPVLPEGRVTASCRASLAGRTPRRADMTACMKTSCCRVGNGQAEDCRAYQKAYPFACSAG